MKKYFFIVLLLVGLYNNSTNAQSNNKSSEPSLNGNWYLIPVLPSDTATGKIPTLTFNIKKKQFSGNDGCNDISGTFVFAEDKMSFSDDIKGIKTECKGYDEKTFLHNLLLTSNYKIQDSILMLMKGKTVLSTWTKENFRNNKVQKKTL